MRKSLLAAIIAIGCSTPQKELSIQVRLGSGSIYHLTREEGEQALHQVARTAKQEDCWIFTNNVWVDVGVDESPEGVRGDGKLFDAVARDPVIEYHIHPRDDGKIYPPSSTDIIRHGNIKRELRARGITLESKVLDRGGIWTYTISHDAEAFLSLKNFRLRGTTFEEVFRALLGTANALFMDREDHPRDERIQQYINEVAAFGLYLHYRKLR